MEGITSLAACGKIEAPKGFKKNKRDPQTTTPDNDFGDDRSIVLQYFKKKKISLEAVCEINDEGRVSFCFSFKGFTKKKKQLFSVIVNYRKWRLHGTSRVRDKVVFFTYRMT